MLFPVTLSHANYPKQPHFQHFVSSFFCIVFGPLLHAKFHPHRCNVSPLRGEKPQNWPLSKLNTGRFALCAMLPVIIFFTKILAVYVYVRVLQVLQSVFRTAYLVQDIEANLPKHVKCSLKVETVTH